MRRLILVCMMSLALASWLSASGTNNLTVNGVNQNQIGDLKARVAQMKAQGHYDKALWKQYFDLVGTDRFQPRVHSHHLDQGGDNCASATVIASLPYSDAGTTIGYADDYGDCVGTGSPDVVYAYTPAVNQTANVSLCGSTYDTGLLIYAGSCAGSPIACNDDFCGFQSEVDNVALSAGTTYYIVVDGFGGDAGDYTLNITPIITGRCCYSNNLLCATTTDVDCDVLGGVFTAGETCDTPCPPPPPQCLCGPMDLVFVIDTTGSMGPAIASVVAQLPDIIATANYFSCDVRLGLVTFGDQVMVNDQLTTDEATVEGHISTLSANGGNNIPEANDEAVLEVVNGSAACKVNSWTSVFRPGATKIVVLVTDAPPGGCDDTYDPGVDPAEAHAVAVAAQAAGIRIAAIYVPDTPGNDPIVIPVMQDYATTTSGVYRETASNGNGTGGAIASLVANCGQGILQVHGQPNSLQCVNGVITPNPASFTVAVSNTGNLACTGVVLHIGASTGNGGTGTITPDSVYIGMLDAGAVDSIQVTATLSPDTAGGQICFRADLTSDACPPAFVDLCFNDPACQGGGMCQCVMQDPCNIPPGCFRTETQIGWDQTCCADPDRTGGDHNLHGPCGNPGCILDSAFASVFPAGLTVGGNFTIHLSSANAVQNYLPEIGLPHVLTANHVDPNSTESHVFGADVVSLALNLAFSNAGVPCYCPGLGNLVVPTGVHSPNGPFAGWSVNQIFALANQVLGGNTGALPAGITLYDLAFVVSAINSNFDGGFHCEGFLVAPNCDEILPVELSSFTAEGGPNNVTLTWVTASERNIASYDLQRQDGSGSWNTIAHVAGLGDNATGHTYTHRDEGVAGGTLYTYRLLSHEIDGSTHALGMEASAAPHGDATPTAYALAQNYPNPFNPSTSITFDLMEAGKVSLKVYNLVGQQVASLVDGSMDAGRHNINFNAKALPSGVYIYRLNVNGFVAEKKMLLMK
jgi:uncharacterized protein YegL